MLAKLRVLGILLLRDLLLLLAFTHLACSEQLAVKLATRFNNDSIKLLQSVEAQVRARHDLKLMGSRKFGKNSVGHEMVYLHKDLDVISPQGSHLELRKQMLEFARLADESAGWNLTESVTMTARCMEVIRYTGNKHADIGWHTDGGTLLTVAAMLSPKDEYEGGESEFKHRDSVERYVVELGDVMVWRGWIEHRVTQVLSGQRTVFVIEWWLGEDCIVSEDPRGGDDRKTLQHTLEVEAKTMCGGSGSHSCLSTHNRRLGKAICTRVPCNNEDDAAAAENAYRTAIKIEPINALNLEAYGTFLASSRNASARDHGIQLLEEAVSLNPSAAFQSRLDNAIKASSTDYKPFAFAAIVGVIVYFVMMQLTGADIAPDDVDDSRGSEAAPPSEAQQALPEGPGGRRKGPTGKLRPN